MKNYILLFALLYLGIFNSCKKLVQVELPIDKQPAEIVYKNAEVASLVLGGLYQEMGQNGSLGIVGPNGISIGFGLASDDLRTINTNLTMYILGGGAHVGNTYWNNIYGKHLFTVNSVISGVSNSDKLAQVVKDKLIGEAKFIRAFLFFYLVNIYGDIPLVLTTDFKINSNISKSSRQLVYDTIIADLLESQRLLGDQYLAANMAIDPLQERVRPNKAAATALLARVYLYLGHWQNAENESTKLISNPVVYSLVALDNVFLKNSRETIWALQPNLTGVRNANTLDGNTIVPTANAIPRVFLSPHTIASFDENDLRKTVWTKTVTSGTSQYVIPFKYRVRESLVSSEYVMVLRLAEQYLIRAEARIQNNKISEGIADLNVLRARASNISPATLTAIPGNISQSSALGYVTRERQSELFSEWGHRWFDLKRTGKIDQVMSERSPLKIVPGGSASWSSFKALLPIPIDEFKYNLALKGQQNPGYPEVAP